jgi:hypothetical protein
MAESGSKSKPRTYEPPKAVDLSGNSATGQGIVSPCVLGQQADPVCNTGMAARLGCHNGGLASNACSPGSVAV